jgi:hypothetical protein
MQSIRTTLTRGAEVLRAGLDTGLVVSGAAFRRARSRRMPQYGATDVCPIRTSFRAAAAIFCTTLLAACATSAPPPVSAIPTTAGACEALRPAFPITYHGQKDQPDTVGRIKAANASFLAACP